MSDLTSYLSTVNRPPVKFHPPKNFKLPKSIALVHKGRIGDLFVRSGVHLRHLLLASL